MDDRLTAAVCARCGGILRGSIVRDDRGDGYCRHCTADSLPCFACGAPVRDAAAADRFRLCPRCCAAAVVDPQHTARMLVEMRTVLAHRLDLRIPGRIGLQTANDAELQLLARRTVPAGRVIGLFRRSATAATIVVRSGLPLLMLRATLAHELAHAWQTAVCPLPLPTARAEGHAEWVAYRALVALGARAAAERLRAPYLPYARELAAFLRIEARGGPAAVHQVMIGHADPLA
jgi:hypothetical protein